MLQYPTDKTTRTVHGAARLLLPIEDMVSTGSGTSVVVPSPLHHH